jgi:hypothetical protein
MASVADPRPPCGVHPAVASSWSGRPVSSCPVSSCLVSGRLVSSPSGVRPAAVYLFGVQPAAAVRPRSVRTRPSRPTSGGGVGDRVGAAGTPHHRNGSRSGGLPRRGAAGSTAEQARTRARLPTSRVVGGVGGGPRPGWVRAAARDCWGPGRPGRRRSAVASGCAAGRSRLRREMAAAAAWPPLFGLVGDHVGWWSWCLTPGVAGPGRASGRAGRGGRAAPARPELAAGAPGSLPAAL